MARGLLSPQSLRCLGLLSNLGRRQRPSWSALQLRTCGSQSDMAGVHKSPIVQLLWKERANLQRVTATGGKPQEKLLTKTASDSRVAVSYNFKDDLLLKEQYANFNGLIQFSKLFEDLDALAGNVAFKHCDDDDPETRMPHLVTASVDRIRLAPGIAISLDQNYQMSGQVSWVGSSSLIIHMKLTRESDSVDVLAANFTFVARDIMSGKSCKVNRLEPETEEEKKLFQMADDKNKARRLARAAGKTASNAETDATHTSLAKELLDQGRLLQDMPGLAVGDAVLIHQTQRETMIICQPQQRNTAGRMFGGYLMRCAYRCAFPTAYMFAGSFPHFVEVDEVSFIHPVEVGDICEFNGRVMLTYTKVRPILHVEVTASVLKPDQKSSLVTNVFNFVFELRPKPGQALPVIKRVFPATNTVAQRVVSRLQKEKQLTLAPCVAASCESFLQVLDVFKIGQARVVVVANESRNRANQVATAIRAKYPDLPMVVRAKDSEHKEWLESALGVKALMPAMIAVRQCLSSCAWQAVGPGAWGRESPWNL
ncbi:Acot10 [Symbiodinium pilosum]|uniref:Acot10 protein n=1 Tax=Symbiodinium pilosum TaxID=2952 RepID=A0A812PUQ8_SYMPI|nr:Acot10 [Symbiodinium pilosum]